MAHCVGVWSTLSADYLQHHPMVWFGIVSKHCGYNYSWAMVGVGLPLIVDFVDDFSVDHEDAKAVLCVPWYTPLPRLGTVMGSFTDRIYDC